MASDSTFDITSEFDYQELRNAVDQCKREVLNRYDFKGVHTEIDLQDDKIVITTSDVLKIKAVLSVLIQKMVNRGLSARILDPKDPEDSSGGNKRQEYTLIKSLDQETAKKINKMIRDAFPKAKGSIQGNCVRVSSKSRDELQAIMKMLKEKEEIKVALQFGNYR